MQHRALWFTGPHTIDIRSDDLRAPRDGELLVRTLASGISAGTEMLAYRGQLDPDMPVDETIGALGGTFRYPFRYGYSCVGVIDESRADDVAVGEIVFAFQSHQDRFVVPAGDVIPIGGLDPRHATLFPLVETALQIGLDAGPVAFEPVVVYGLGVIGTLTALVLQRAGARVLAVEPAGWRRQLIADLGIDAVSPEALGDALAARRIEHVPLAVEASGNPRALAGALDVVGHEGTVQVASWYGTKPVELPLGGAFHRRRLTIRSTQVSTIPAHLGTRWNVDRRRTTALELLGELPIAALATHTFAFDQADAAYAAVAGGDHGLMHVALGYT